MPIDARMVTQEQDGIPGYMAMADGPGPRPGVLMVHHAHGVTADYKIDAYRLAQLGFNVLVPSLFNMFGIGGTTHIGQGADLQAKHSDGEFLEKNIATPAIQAPLWQSFRENGQLVEWHYFSDAHHGFRHPDNAGFQPHYADLTWPLTTSFLQKVL